MTEYADKLFSLTEKKKKLLAEEVQLIEKRKKEMGVLVEKFGLLTLSDAILSGAFNEIKTALKDHPDKIKSWEIQGELLFNRKRDSKATQENKG